MKRELPGLEFWALIHPHTGDVTETRPAERSFSSDLTALVECEKGPFFVKAMRNRPGGRRNSLAREKLINPAVHPVSPALLWSAEDDDWLALGFEVVHGRRADFTPDSTDLPVVTDALDRIGRLPLPDVAQDWAENRWDRFLSERETELLRGDSLIHADTNPSNFVIGESHVWVVDWAWPTRGAAFISPACLAEQLIASGHTAAGAEAWAAQCEGWADADPAAIDAFAVATWRMNKWRADRSPEESWLGAMVEAARTWAEHRGVAGRAAAWPQ
ncbi:protein kinase family protein [Streptomyces daliensis]|uniref:Phosphotransferase n=1 Tax=Streptomyces daliensis TaxID=299421 RepID=A0A8T4IHT2_9ACTN|nr:phosphotransferase [Streptomyces daliensis]